MKTAIVQKLFECRRRLRKLEPELKVPDYKITFELRGASAGTCRRDGSALNFNLGIAEDNRDDFLARTVPHEFAHLVVTHNYDTEARQYLRRKRIRPHGKEWESIMNLLGAPTSRCHNYDVSNHVTSRQRRWEYECKCPDKTHAVSTTRHNKVQDQTASYNCGICHTILNFTGKEVM